MSPSGLKKNKRRIEFTPQRELAWIKCHASSSCFLGAGPSLLCLGTGLDKPENVADEQVSKCIRREAPPGPGRYWALTAVCRAVRRWPQAGVMCGQQRQMGAGSAGTARRRGEGIWKTGGKASGLPEGRRNEFQFHTQGDLIIHTTYPHLNPGDGGGWRGTEGRGRREGDGGGWRGLELLSPDFSSRLLIPTASQGLPGPSRAGRLLPARETPC